MEKNKKIDNILIKRKNLVLELKKNGIDRISPDSLLLLESYLRDCLSKIVELLREEVIVHGRRTLKKEDVLAVLNRLKKEEVGWEI